MEVTDSLDHCIARLRYGLAVWDPEHLTLSTGSRGESMTWAIQCLMFGHRYDPEVPLWECHGRVSSYPIFHGLLLLACGRPWGSGLEILLHCSPKY